MSSKVLVFESDASFAAELRTELGKMGAVTRIVDDGNLGLQLAATDRPDLILLSIELPRMNGFSICNKLKKDPILREVPLIIMSSESSETTFEEHKKLRTRADDYVRKPISFGALLGHIQRFVNLAEPSTEPPPPPPPRESLESILLEDEISLEEVVDEHDEVATPHQASHFDDEPNTGMMERVSILPEAPPRSVRPAAASPSSMQPAGSSLDADVDAFADGAFDALMGVPPQLHPDPNLTVAAPERASALPSLVAISPSERRSAERLSLQPPLPTAASAAEQTNGIDLTNSTTMERLSNSGPPSSPRVAAVRSSSAPPRPASMIDSSELERLRAEVDKHKERVLQLERDLATARDEAQRAQNDKPRDAYSQAEMQRLQRELDDLKAKQASGSKLGGVSSREFLDLREALNRKDKEILSLRDQQSRKERDLLEVREASLLLERIKADLEDRTLELERTLDTAKQESDALRADKDQAAKRAEDFKTRSERLKTELDGVRSEFASFKQKHDQEIAERTTAETSLKEQHASALSSLVKQNARDLEETQAQGREELARAVAETQHQGHEELVRAVAQTQALAQQAQERAMAEVTAAATADMHQALLQAAADAAAALEARTEELHQEQQNALAALRAARDEETSKLQASHDHAMAQARAEGQSRLAAREEELFRQGAEKLAQMQRQHEMQFGELRDKHSKQVRQLDEERAHLIAEHTVERESLEEQIANRLSDLDSLRAAKITSEAERDGRLAALQSELAVRTEERDQTGDELQAARAYIQDLSTSLDTTRNELADTRDTLARTEERLDKAYQKWEGDRMSLERARNALATVLSSIQEAESRQFE